MNNYVKFGCNKAKLVRLKVGESRQTENGFLTAKGSGNYCPVCAGSYGGRKPKNDMGIDPRTLRGSLATQVFDQLRRDSMAKTPRPTLDPKLVAIVHGKSNVQFMTTKPRRAKRNAANDGRRFQEVVERTAAAYEALGVLRLRKVDPPVKIAGGKILFMENPWPDFVGCLHDRRMLGATARSRSSFPSGTRRFRSKPESEASSGTSWRISLNHHRRDIPIK